MVFTGPYTDRPLGLMFQICVRPSSHCTTTVSPWMMADTASDPNWHWGDPEEFF